MVQNFIIMLHFETYFYFILAQEATVKKIVKIVKDHFTEEIEYKESEIDLIDQVMFLGNIVFCPISLPLPPASSLQVHNAKAR